ncbi:MAG: HAD family acid phosphatase [Candidatus Sumerlaeota bacterium]
MTSFSFSRRITPTLAFLAFTAALSSCAHDHAAMAPASAAPSSPVAIVAPAPARIPDSDKPYNKINVPNRSLDADLYMQTSAEYRALCYQTYDAATKRVKDLMSNRPSDAKAPAVILDLDETVLDNSAFQSFQELEQLGYDGRLWQEWERHPEATRLVPGAKEFLDTATQLGVTLMYVSNRVNVETATQALTHNGLSIDSTHQLYLKNPKDSKPSNKDERRAAILEKYDVLILVGDNLTDFSSDFTAPNVKTSDEATTAINARAAKVDTNRARFGTDWFVLPNCVYGDWQRLVQDDPRAQIRSVDTMSYPKPTPTAAP